MRNALVVLCLASLARPAAADDLGQLSANPFGPNSTSNPFSPAGPPFSLTSVNNAFGHYGSPFSNQSGTNPYATEAPQLYNQADEYRGRLSSNPYEPDSTSNLFGRYGSRFSPESINSPFGAANPYSPDSPTNPTANQARARVRNSTPASASVRRPDRWSCRARLAGRRRSSTTSTTPPCPTTNLTAAFRTASRSIAG